MLIPAEMPAAGHRARTPLLHGSADALAITRLARAAGRPLAVFTATAADAQRLLEELPFFDPGAAGCTCSRTGRRCPTTSSRRTTTSCPSGSRRSTSSCSGRSTSRSFRSPPRSTASRRWNTSPARSFHFQQGARLAPEELKRQLVTAGYAHVTQVVAPGEYCVRGGLIDIYPMGSALPYRIELDDDIVESIRSFDADTQRSIYKVNEVRLLPAREFPLDEAAQARFRQSFRGTLRGRPVAQPRLQGHLQRRAHGGDRVLPAALLREDGAHHRLPAAGHRDRDAGSARSRRSSSSGATPIRATRCCAATAPIRRCRRTISS